MNKKELEKMFDDKFPTLKESRFERFNSMPNPKELKDFIFDELIKEVLTDLVIEYDEEDRLIYNKDREYVNGYIDKKEVIIEKAKEKFGITL